jgi:hypothetical protein
MSHHDVPEDAVFSRSAATPRSAGKPRRKPEAEIVAEGIIMLRALPNGYARKVHGGAMGNVGEPDVDACVAGRSCKFEAKAIGEKPTGPQLGSMRRWASVGALVGWFRSNAHLEQLLEHIDEREYVTDLTEPGCSCPRHGGAE